MALTLMKGSEAIAEAAIRAGARFFFGYPITPQTEIPEYMSARMPEVGGCFLQAESEVAAINMVYGAAGTGARVMTSSSSPGISLKQEGISYIVGAELPGVIVNMVRGGPGLGSIQPAQSDYYQSTRGGGHGDYRMLVLAPSSVQEAVELTQLAFDLADRYRNPVLIMGDGLIGQMMEPISFEDAAKQSSTCPSGQEGGCLGDFGRGQMVPEFDQACFSMEVGELRGPIQTQFGYHLIRLNAKNEAKQIPFETMKDDIIRKLTQDKQQAAYQSKINQLKILYPVDKF